ncbi:gluconate 2-dehydrogenase subunit 3 family protein [soil metagenome]
MTRGDEVSPPLALPVPHPPAGGGGRTPYPEYDVMMPDKWAHDWDAKTRQLVLDRIRNVPTRAFFSTAEFRTLEAICRRLLPQQDRPSELRIPIAPFIDERLARDQGNGYRYEQMPWDSEAYRRGLAGIEETSDAMFGAGFPELTGAQQDRVLSAVEGGEPVGETWRHLPAERFFKLLLQDAVEVYYAHPTAWNEIGFQGPASPRGHVRLSLGMRDPWEAEETQPIPAGERQTAAEQHGAAPGHGGATH